MNERFVASILSPDTTKFFDFMEKNFPEVKFEIVKNSFSYNFTFMNVSFNDGKSMLELWADSCDNN